jgi:hypothetical protein
LIAVFKVASSAALVDGRNFEPTSGVTFSFWSACENADSQTNWFRSLFASAMIIIFCPGWPT